MNNLKAKQLRRSRRKHGVRKNISGTAVTPRISIAKSNKWVFVQAIDDIQGTTLTSVKAAKGITNIGDAAKTLAKGLAAKKVENAVFDRNGFKYHGAVKEFADKLREAGIKI